MEASTEAGMERRPTPENKVRSGEGWSSAHLDELGVGPGFRKVRTALGVGAFGVDAPTSRSIRNAGETDAVYVSVGGKDGYVGRDGRVPEGEEERMRTLHGLRDGGEG